MRTLKLFCGCAAAVLILSGCGGGSGSSSTPASASNPPPTAKGTATLRWTAPTSNSDGSALTDLAGYHIYYGTSAGALSSTINVPSPATLTYVVSGLSTGTWYFGIAAYTNAGLESGMSNVGSKTIS